MKTIGEVDRISINTNHLACTWKVGIKERDSIKGKKKKEKGGRNWRVKLVTRLEKNI